MHNRFANTPLVWSGKRGSNSRPRPWQGRALPTELFPQGIHVKIWSGKRGSNSRPRPWQGRALPTELFPHFTLVNEATLYEKIYATQAQILQMIEFA